jgi:putative membrane protein
MMNLFTVILILLVAAEHLYIMFLETFATTSRHTSKTFNIDVDELSNHHISTLLKNQGVYNGCVSLWRCAFAAINQDLLWSRLLLGYVILVALYGTWSSDLKDSFQTGRACYCVTLAVSFIV